MDYDGGRAPLPRGVPLPIVWARAAVVALVVVAASPSARAQSCPTGQTVGPDTAGHCCWPQQAYSSARGACVGVPECPAGYTARGEMCVAGAGCPDGQQMTEETHGRCCWSGQVWSASRGLCVGIPMCPAQLRVSGETCVPPGAAAPPPPTTPSTTTTPPPATTTPPAPATPPPPGMEAVEPSAQPAPAVVTPAANLPRFPMRFEARADRDVFRVRAAGRSCTTPCTLDLPPGELQVHVDGGSRSLDSRLKVPGVPSVVKVSYPSRATYAVGGALLALGLADTAVGFYFAVSGNFDNHQAVGAVNIVLGTVATIVGIVNLASAGRARLELRPSSPVARLFGAGVQ